MENGQEFKVENKHLRALSSLFFLGPLVPMALQKGNYDLKPGDLEFIKGYVKFGIFLDFLFAAYIVLSAYNYMNYTSFMFYVVNIVLFAIIVFIFVGIYMIFKDQNFSSVKDQIAYSKIRPGNVNMLFYYAPIYNLSLWYDKQNEIKSYRRLKESIIFLSLFVIANFISQFIGEGLTTFINVIFIGGYLFRLISLIGGMDIIPDFHKERLDGLFENNPEEIYAYAKGSAIYIYKKARAKNLEMSQTIQQIIDQQKSDYKKYNDFKINGKINKLLLIEYILLLILILFYIYLNYRRITFDILGLIYLLPGVLFIGRYLMILNTKKMPHIPVIYEIVYYTSQMFKFLK